VTKVLSLRQDGVMELDMEAVVEAARLAPSVHNTQPWQLVLAADGLEVRADRSRQLAFLDPTARQLHLSCGAAVEFARIALRATGHECSVETLPDADDPDLLARLRVGEAEPASDVDRALAAAIPRRYTDRGPYDEREVPAAVLDDIGRRCGELDAWVRVLAPDERSAVVVVLADAEAAEAGEPQYAEELARWTASRRQGEGIPPEALPSWPGDRVSDVPLRDFGGHAVHPRPADTAAGNPPGVERDTVVMLGTALDEPGWWVAAGRGLGWALLRIVAAGLSAQPLGQAIDLASGRARLRRELHLVGHPQFLLRIGYGAGQPSTRRRE
jgi:nitroreductase